MRNLSINVMADDDYWSVRQMQEHKVKKPYVKPELKSHGSVEELTMAFGDGGILDADYPRNTPRSDLTFTG